MISILLVGNQLSREGLRALIEMSQNSYEIKDGASDGHEALQKVEELKPDIVLADADLSGFNGVELARESKIVSPQTKVIIYSTKSDEKSLLSSLRAGVKGYVLKTESFSHLCEAMLKVHSGYYYLSDEVWAKIIEYYVQSNHNDKFEILTSREKEILLLVKDGLPNRQIARQLQISNRTVEAHRFNAIKKLNLRNPMQLARYLIEEVEPNYVTKA